MCYLRVGNVNHIVIYIKIQLKREISFVNTIYVDVQFLSPGINEKIISDI